MAPIANRRLGLAAAFHVNAWRLSLSGSLDGTRRTIIL
jgi:hypothetical protein